MTIVRKRIRGEGKMSLWGAEDDVNAGSACRLSGGAHRHRVAETEGSTSLVMNRDRTPLGLGCWSRALSDDCSIEFSAATDAEVQFDMSMDGCADTWAAVWLRPTVPDQSYPVAPGKKMREIDVVEVCGEVPANNYDGAGVQAEWSPLLASRFGPHRFHVIYDSGKDEVTTKACPLDASGEEDLDSCFGAGNYPKFLGGVDPVRSQKFRLKVDIWNDGPNRCGGSHPQPDSTCSFTVSNLRAYNKRLVAPGDWAIASMFPGSAKCAPLDLAPAPAPAPAPGPAPGGLPRCSQLGDGASWRGQCRADNGGYPHACAPLAPETRWACEIDRNFPDPVGHCPPRTALCVWDSTFGSA